MKTHLSERKKAGILQILTLLMKSYVNMEFFLAKNLKTGTN